jgi:hypothetical protein
MKLKLFLSLLLATPFFLANSSNILAAACEIASWNENSRTLNVCVGEFNSPTELRGATANVNCLNNSNLLEGGFCTGITGPASWDLSSTPDSEITADTTGKYYTCFDVIGVNRAIGELNVSFSGTSNCVTANIITQPSDWNPLVEGNIFGQAATAVVNSPVIAGGGCQVNGTQGINTALGCISIDAAGGGFVRSLLGLAIGLGGGIALLLILYGVFIVTTSAGIPDKLKEGKELISSAIAGLIFIILAIFLMNLVGIQILKLPGLQ